MSAVQWGRRKKSRKESGFSLAHLPQTGRQIFWLICKSVNYFQSLGAAFLHLNVFFFLLVFIFQKCYFHTLPGSACTSRGRVEHLRFDKHFAKPLTSTSHTNTHIGKKNSAQSQVGVPVAFAGFRMALSGGSHIAVVHADGEEHSVARFVGFHKRKGEGKLPDLLLDRLGLRKEKKKEWKKEKASVLM